MPLVTEVVLDREGRITLPPEVLEILASVLPKGDEDKVRLLCTVHERGIVLASPEAVSPLPEEQDWLEQQHKAFLRSPLGQYMLAELEEAGEDIPAIEEVRQALSQDQSSWAADVIAEREERV